MSKPRALQRIILLTPPWATIAMSSPLCSLRIRSKHVVILSEKLTTHLDEIRPGAGGLDYAAFVKELSKFPELPLMMEHLKTQAEYKQAADYIRSVAQKNDL